MAVSLIRLNEATMGIAENIDAILVKFDINQDALARIAGVTGGAVSGWRKGARPRQSAIDNICKHLPLTEDDIMSDSAGLAAKEHGTHIPPNAIPVRAGNFSPVPLRGRVHAGNPTEAENIEAREETVDIPTFLVEADGDTYAAIAEGDCMNLTYPEGCIIAISPNKPPQNGSVAVVTIDGADTVMRRMYKTANTLVLSPESTNPEHKDIVISNDDEHVVEFGGRVVWFQSNGEME